MILGKEVDWIHDPEYVNNIDKAVIHAAVLLKTFLRSLGEPVITNKLYPKLLEIQGNHFFILLSFVTSGFLDPKSNTESVRAFVWTLKPANFLLLKTIVQFLTEVAAHSHKNLMTPDNLSIVFGPNLTWPTDQQVPLTQIIHLNNFCAKLIIDYEVIFEKQ